MRNVSETRVALHFDASNERSTFHWFEHPMGEIPWKNMYAMACIAQ